MSWKKVLVILAGSSFPIWGIINYFVRLQGVTTNSPSKSVNIGFALIGLILIIGLLWYQQGFWYKIYVGGVTMFGLTVPTALLGYYILDSKWHWVLWFMLPLMSTMGWAMILHAKAHIEPVKLAQAYEGVQYCPKCGQVFPFAMRKEHCRNGCLP